MRARIGMLVVALMAFMFSSAAVPLCADELNRVSESVAVIKELMAMPEMNVPPALFKDAAAIAVIPGVMKGGLIVAGRFGTGVMSVRDKSGEWSPPAFISLGGGSLGWQVGAQSTDFILVFKNRRGIDGIVKGRFTLGVDASAAAGPVGRTVEVATDALMKAEIVSYSRSRGLFAGVSMEGAVLHIDADANAAFYSRKGVKADDIFSGKVATDSREVMQFRELLKRYVSGS